MSFDPVEVFRSHPALGLLLILLLGVAIALMEMLTRTRPGAQTTEKRIAALARSLGLDGLPRGVFLFIALTWLLIAATLLVGLYVLLWKMIWQPAPQGDEETWNWRFSLAQIAALTTVLGAVIALPLTMSRLLLTRRQTETAEQGLITDRINKAVEGLGAEKTVSFQRRDAKGKLTFEKHANNKPNYAKPVMVAETRPNLEVRIGAIYALERIAQDSDRDHVQIMEILCAYIRQNAPASEAEPWPEIEIRESEADGPLEDDWDERVKAFQDKHEKAMQDTRIREDIQVALSVIGRRSEKQRRLEAEAKRGKKGDPFVFDKPYPDHAGSVDSHDPAALTAFEAAKMAWDMTAFDYPGYRLDLRGAKLRGADLSGLNLNGAQMHGVELHGARLSHAKMQGAFLNDAGLQGARLVGAHLQGAFLNGARMQGAELSNSRMQGAMLNGAQMQGANLDGASMQGVYLGVAGFQGADLRSVRMQGAHLSQVRMQGADLAKAQLQAAHLNEIRLHGAHFRYVRTESGGDTGNAVPCAAALRHVDCSNMPQITEHLAQMFGDASVTLPGGHGPEHADWPAHWPKFALDDASFHKEWRKWQADPDTYDPPDPPEAPG